MDGRLTSKIGWIVYGISLRSTRSCHFSGSRDGALRPKMSVVFGIRFGIRRSDCMHIAMARDM